MAATYTVAELLRNGVTTFMDFGAQLPTQEALREEVDRLGIRAYLGPSFRSLNWVGDRNGRIKRVWDEDAAAATSRSRPSSSRNTTAPATDAYVAS